MRKSKVSNKHFVQTPLHDTIWGWATYCGLRESASFFSEKEARGRAAGAVQSMPV